MFAIHASTCINLFEISLFLLTHLELCCNTYFTRMNTVEIVNSQTLEPKNLFTFNNKQVRYLSVVFIHNEVTLRYTRSDALAIFRR